MEAQALHAICFFRMVRNATEEACKHGKFVLCAQGAAEAVHPRTGHPNTRWG